MSIARATEQKPSRIFIGTPCRNSNGRMPNNKACQIILYSDNEWIVLRQSDSADVANHTRYRSGVTSLVSSAHLDWSAQHRLTRPALYCSTISGHSAPVKIAVHIWDREKVSKCCTQLHAQESGQPRMDTLWKDVHYERWRDITHSVLYKQPAVTDWDSYWQIWVIVESRMQLGAIQEHNSPHSPITKSWFSPLPLTMRTIHILQQNSVIIAMESRIQYSLKPKVSHNICGEQNAVGCISRTEFPPQAYN